MYDGIKLLLDEPDCLGNSFNFQKYANHANALLSSERVTCPFTVASGGWENMALRAMIWGKFLRF